MEEIVSMCNLKIYVILILVIFDIFYHDIKSLPDCHTYYTNEQFL